jgi:hypothetical protein
MPFVVGCGGVGGIEATPVAEDGIEPRAGERWKIYTQSRRQPLATSICAGSVRVATPTG